MLVDGLLWMSGVNPINPMHQRPCEHAGPKPKTHVVSPQKIQGTTPKALKPKMARTLHPEPQTPTAPKSTTKSPRNGSAVGPAQRITGCRRTVSGSSGSSGPSSYRCALGAVPPDSVSGSEKRYLNWGVWMYTICGDHWRSVFRGARRFWGHYTRVLALRC